LGITHAVVVAQYEHNSVFFREARQGSSDSTLSLVAKNFGERGRCGMVQEAVNIDFLQRGALLVFPSSQFVDAVVGCYLRNPRAERHHLIFLVQHSVELQEDFRSGILGIFKLTKKLSADPQNVAIVRDVEHSQ
jgi:hypothetical protein